MFGIDNRGVGFCIMPTIKVYHHGTTCCCPSESNHARVPRGEVGGWSPRSIRSNVRFLYSIDESRLTGHGVALTLTVRDCPAAHDDWHKIRAAFIKRLQRMGLIRMHWAIEWQSRGVPHLHAAVWFPEGNPGVWAAILRHWLQVGERYRPEPHAQYLTPITDSVGWFKYVSKHAARGLSHYQRSPENVPEGWEKTGRMWGYLGDWPLRDAMVFEASLEAFWRYRRLCRAWRVADARRDRSRPGMSPETREKVERVRRRRISSARRALACADRRLSEVRGVSEWIPDDVQVRMIVYLISQGLDVEQIG